MIQPIRRLAVRLWRDTSGATAIEYGLIIALLFLAALGAMTLMGGSVTEMINTAMTLIAGALS
jgi:pilus assembly protein Flp/PilA